jgi:hypothetical protein
VLPMIVAPEAIVKCFSDIDSKIDSCIVGANYFPLFSCHSQTAIFNICRVYASVEYTVGLASSS